MQNRRTWPSEGQCSRLLHSGCVERSNKQHYACGRVAQCAAVTPGFTGSASLAGAVCRAVARTAVAAALAGCIAVPLGLAAGVAPGVSHIDASGFTRLSPAIAAGGVGGGGELAPAAGGHPRPGAGIPRLYQHVHGGARPVGHVATGASGSGGGRKGGRAAGRRQDQVQANGETVAACCC
eukprot:364481-Chlamydomonas_euryale.AAC.12